MSFANRVRALREARNWNQEDVGNRLNPKVTKAAVASWESGKSQPRMYRLEQLADLFDTTVAELMGEAPEPVRPNGAQYVTLPVLVAGHAGEFTDEFGPDEVADVANTEACCRSSLLMLTNRQNTLTVPQHADRTWGFAPTWDIRGIRERGRGDEPPRPLLLLSPAVASAG